MSSQNRTRLAYLVAVVVFAACVGVMMLMQHVRPGEAARRSPSGRENLDAPREVQGVPCTGYVQLAPDGRLASCVLQLEHEFGPVTLPANTQFYLRPDGSVKDVHLGKDAVFDGHACLGRGPGQWMTGFHPNGRLAYCFLAADETVDGVPCRHGSFWGEVTGKVIASFHDDGRLAGCRLAADVTIAGRTFPKGARIALDRSGNVVPAGTRAE